MTKITEKESADVKKNKDIFINEDIEQEDLQKKFNELNEKYIRMYADFENSKKIAARDRLSIMETVKRGDIMDFLPIADAVEDTIAAALSNEQNGNMASFIEGVKLILKKINSILSEKGVTEIKAKGVQFDPTVHEVVMVNKNTKLPKGIITDQLQKGYMLNKFCLRPAKVVVSGNEENNKNKSVKIETEEENE